MMPQRQNIEGVRLYQQGNYHAAMDKFNQAVLRDPSDPDAYYNLAATHHRLGNLNQKQDDIDQAESFYNQCLDHADALSEEHKDCYRALAVLLVEQNRSEEAFRLLDGWTTRNPMSPDAEIEYARLFEEFGDVEAAKEHLLSAISNDPYNARALAAVGRINEAQGNLTQALADYKRSLWHDRFQPEVAARMTALQRAVGGSPLVTSPTGTRTVGIRLPTLQ